MKSTILALLLAAAAVPAGAQELQARVQNGHFTAKGGQAVYEMVCQGCHMADAKGAEGSGKYPALAGNPKLAAAAYPLRMVVLGQKGMPAFGEFLDDRQVADVVGYIRTHFGNSYAAPVTVEQVKAQRPAAPARRRRRGETAG